MNAPVLNLTAAQTAGHSMKIIRATTEEVVVSIVREPGSGWPALTLKLDGHDYATINPSALVTGDAAVAELTIPLPKLPDGRPHLVAVADAATGALAPGSNLRPIATAKNLRALVIYPAGEVYDHDKVRWYRAPMDKLLSDYFNIGDMIVYDSTLKLLKYAHLEPMKIMSPTDADIERYASEFDYVFVRGSNFIHEKMEWYRAVEVLEKVKLPVYAIGVGAQASQNRAIELSEGSKRFWSIVSERSAAIGVRGAFSAETLRHNGIRNVDVIGCPSIFRTRKRDLVINVPDQRNIRKVAFSLRREADRSYTADPAAYLRNQKAALLKVDDQSEMVMSSHGEQEEKAFFLRDPAAKEKAVAEFVRTGWWSGSDDTQMRKIYEKQLFSFFDVERYDEFARSIDLAVGYRVHGVLPAVAQGVPGVLVAYDTRSQELAETLKIPVVPEAALAEGGWRAVYQDTQLNGLARSYAQSYDRMRGFLEKNGVPHRM
ncbi:polysaccharide pyruvyl transferase family protein [Bosea caraganae]|uniref:Polysaccharide pyruvyl transferase family protein n=1 Tax=Bosea caraganae TaxID=2763117 RepID=A0A370L372_9HYPH|nr:polysaccharide pyruvyl transferase family protein [Bosea caraganae]RDJ22156.1 polysaccharide pyruvyl transferase family protein [Bosea caraganae]RDJ22757.1 polysaccharide pyruvyl transferase family protein [Bosea caraganae]